nr:uncharacterized protein LOC129383889 [Dermacentor andersoni]
MSTEPRVNHSMVGVMEQQIHWLNVSLTRSPPKMVMRDGATGVDRFSAPPSATLPCDNAIKEEASRVFACGHGAGIVNMRLNHPFLFLVQVRNDRPVHCYRSNNVCLLLVPCPQRVFSLFAAPYYHCIGVLPCLEALLMPLCELLLLICGDVERNPGPMNDQLTEMHKLMKDMHERSIRIEAAQMTMSSDILELKSEQQSLTKYISTIVTRLESVEKRTSILDDVQCELTTTRKLTEQVESEALRLRVRLDEAEDRSRRDNLVFFGILDNASKTAQQTEENVLSLIRQSPETTLSADNIARAHRIGRFSTNKVRPIIVKFSTYKTKETIFSKRHMLKGSRVVMREDFSANTRRIREKLTNYAKELNSPFKLRYNKLIANDTCYGYDCSTDAVP